jgi:hypothetical protein
MTIKSEIKDVVVQIAHALNESEYMADQLAQIMGGEYAPSTVIERSRQTPVLTGDTLLLPKSSVPANLVGLIDNLLKGLAIYRGIRADVVWTEPLVYFNFIDPFKRWLSSFVVDQQNSAVTFVYYPKPSNTSISDTMELPYPVEGLTYSNLKQLLQKFVGFLDQHVSGDVNSILDTVILSNRFVPSITTEQEIEIEDYLSKKYNANSVMMTHGTYASLLVLMDIEGIPNSTIKLKKSTDPKKDKAISFVSGLPVNSSPIPLDTLTVKQTLPFIHAQIAFLKRNHGAVTQSVRDKTTTKRSAYPTMIEMLSAGNTPVGNGVFPPPPPSPLVNAWYGSDAYNVENSNKQVLPSSSSIKNPPSCPQISGGSAPKYVLRNDYTNACILVKKYQTIGQPAVEAFCALVHRALGLYAPDMRNDDGNLLYSPLLDSVFLETNSTVNSKISKKQLSNNNPKISQNAYNQAIELFVVSCWLVNWDVMGMTGDNVLYKPSTGDLACIDFGGALMYRATGGVKGSGFDGKWNEPYSVVEQEMEKVWTTFSHHSTWTKQFGAIPKYPFYSTEIIEKAPNYLFAEITEKMMMLFHPDYDLIKGLIHYTNVAKSVQASGYQPFKQFSETDIDEIFEQFLFNRALALYNKFH